MVRSPRLSQCQGNRAEGDRGDAANSAANRWHFRDAEHRHTVVPQTSSPPVNSMVISVKVVTSSIVTACTFTAVPTTVFAELLAMAVAERSESERAMLAQGHVHVASGRVGTCVRRPVADCWT